MKHFRQIDGLRFVAIFFVFIEHFAIILAKHISAGYYGVDLFFVISGFLITGILLKTHEPFWKSYKKFIARRTLRIFPLYYASVIILFLVHYSDVDRYFINYLTYTYTYAWVYSHNPGSMMTHFWSLCVEEQFYLFWPFLVLPLRKNLKALKLLVLFIIFSSAIQLCFGTIKFLIPYDGVSVFPKCYSLAIGAFGSILLKENKIPKKLLENHFFEYVFIISLIFLLVFSLPIKFILCPVISLFFVLKASHKGFYFKAFNSLLSNKNIVYIGSISYGIYIFHLPLGYFFTTYVFDPVWLHINFKSMGYFEKVQWQSWIIKFLLYFALSVILASISYKYFEKPILSLKDRFFKYQ